MSANKSSVDPVSRRSFLKAGAAIASAAALTSIGTGSVYAAGSDRIRVGLVGCGGRGTGAAGDCISSNDGVELVAMADLFKDRLDGAHGALSSSLGSKFAVTPEKCFLGFDAYQEVLASDIDLVILATPPVFRPGHIAAAVAAGKHIFAEKPCGVDAPGIRSVLESASLIDQKKLAFVCGTQRRHENRYLEAMKLIHDGALGDIVSGNVYWNQGYLWKHDRQPEWSDMEWQVRNWIYFTWLSGDHLVEQHVHNIDVFNWAMNGHPVSAYGMGGRQVRVEPIWGQVFDHFAIEFAYPNGVRMASQCRQIDGCESRVGEHVVGTKGTFDSIPFTIKDRSGKTTFQHKPPKPTTTPAHPTPFGPYQQEHVDLVNSIRMGTPLNEAKRIAESTMTAIMGRMSTYTGKLVTWEQAMNSQQNLMPTELKLGDMVVPPVAMPGKDVLI